LSGGTLRPAGLRSRATVSNTCWENFGQHPAPQGEVFFPGRLS